MELAQNAPRTFRIIVDHHPHEWSKSHINGSEIKVLAGVDASYGVWQDLAGPTDPPVADDEEVDLTRPGVERFFTEERPQQKAAKVSFLPFKDREYLMARGVAYDELESGPEHALRLKEWLLPVEKFDIDKVDVLILLPAGYPDYVRPDMFYLFPWIRLRATGQPPRAADQPHNFVGLIWQRWSRHSDEWRSGRDGIWTMIKRIEHALEIAA